MPLIKKDKKKTFHLEVNVKNNNQYSGSHNTQYDLSSMEHIFVEHHGNHYYTIGLQENNVGHCYFYLKNLSMVNMPSIVNMSRMSTNWQTFE